MNAFLTPQELAKMLGDNIKTLRLQKNKDRLSLCAQAGISETALRNLEGGKGATVNTLIRVLKALNKIEWLNQLAPTASINPLHIVKNKQRQRASRVTYGKKVQGQSL